MFGLVDLDNFELTGIQEFTRFWTLLMFGSYSVIIIIVLINLLIAMMSSSYNIIFVSICRKDFLSSYNKNHLCMQIHYR